MKATIKKSMDIKGNCFFYVYANGDYVTCFVFKPEVADDDLYAEKKAHEDAMQLVKRIEAAKSMDDLKGETVIYETPNQ